MSADFSTPEARIAHLISLASQPAQIPLRTMREALEWGDGWEAHARRVEAQNERLQMLLMCAEAHAKASDTLREYAEEELARLKALSQSL